MLMVLFCQQIKSFFVTGFTLKVVVVFIEDDESVGFEPLFEMFNNLATDFVVFNDASCELVWSGFELGFKHHKVIGIFQYFNLF